MRSKKLIIIYGSIALALAIGVSIERFNTAQDGASDPQAQTEITRAAIRDALAGFTRIQVYQPSCTPTVTHIEQSDDVTKIIHAAAPPLYIKQEKKFTCPPESASTQECDTIASLDFETVYTCPKEPLAAFATSTGGLLIKDQIAGTAVVVDRVVLAKPGFVIIFEKDAKEKIGTMIADSLLLKEGIWDIVSIAIPKALVAGQRYAAGIALDNGDGAFDAEDDLVLKDVQRTTLTVPFTAVKEPKKN